MKRFLIFAASVVVSFFAVAQQNTSIEIDPSSFKPVQTNAISGVAIDKIQPDLSRRPCARIKMHINRMSREDIASLSVKTVGGNVVVMKSVVASEGNGLIIELTAKPQTRFYLHHDKYGDSNEVVLDLEGEKEYKLDAELSLLQSIVVSTNVVGADVYIDNDFKGQTGSGMALTVNDMTHGIHNLRVSYGVAKSERQIEVSGSNIHFRIDVDSSLSRPQYVVFVVQPKSASVVIEGKTLLPDADGIVTTVLNSGSYNYLVTAKEHHDEKGAFVVSGSKVQKSVTLRPAYGWLSVPSKGVLVGASVFVDNGFVGQTPVAEHKLSSGTHRVRVVKEMYRAHEGDIVVEDNKRMEYAPTLVADFASVTIDAGGSYDIYVNNELKGESPWSGNLATGAYIFEARKAGHRTTSLSKTISATPAQQRYTLPAPTPIVGTLNVTSTPAMAEVYVDGAKAGETPLMQDFIVGTHKISIRKAGYEPAEQSVTIEEGKMATVAMQMNLVPEKRYKVGDLYNENGKKGIVFEVDASGEHGKILSLEETKCGWNKAKKWCISLGKSWYLPTKEELLSVYANKDIINKILSEKGYTELGDSWYWGQSKYKKFCPCSVYMRNGENYTAIYNPNLIKYIDNYVRAVFAF